MTAQLELIRQQQKDSWNKIAFGWKKWDTMTMDFLKPMGDEIIRFLKPSGKDVVLDIGAGTGEPGLTIASMRPSSTAVPCADDACPIADAIKRTTRPSFLTTRDSPNSRVLRCGANQS